jgi:hypothetical protein
MLEDTFDAEDLEPPGRPGGLERWKADTAFDYPSPTIGRWGDLAHVTTTRSSPPKFLVSFKRFGFMMLQIQSGYQSSL